MVFDLDDRSEVFNETALRHCDVYYKRNFFDEDVNRLPNELRVRVKPFGLNFACRFPGQRWIVLRRAVPSLVTHTLSSPKADLGTFRRRIRHMRAFSRVLPVAAYEQPPDKPVDPVVFFQARVWWEPVVGGRRNIEEEVNRPRVELVRALRRELGGRFVGGLAANEYACREFPDAVSQVSTRREEFIAAGKRMLVGIASGPCAKTGSFKLGEYLAASRCIVSYVWSNRLPSPLVEGVNYLPFRTPDECVQQCVALLEDKALAERMRFNNWDYYRREVAPAAHMDKLLRQCFADDDQPGALRA